MYWHTQVQKPPMVFLDTAVETLLGVPASHVYMHMIKSHFPSNSSFLLTVPMRMQQLMPRVFASLLSLRDDHIDFLALGFGLH